MLQSAVRVRGNPSLRRPALSTERSAAGRYNQGIPAAAIVNDLVARTAELRSGNIAPFWFDGAPQLPGNQPGAQPVLPSPATVPPQIGHSVVAELLKPVKETLVVSLNPALPILNRGKLKENLERLSTPGHGFRLTRLTGGPGVGKSYSYDLIEKVAAELGVTSAYVDVQSKSLLDVCQTIALRMKIDHEALERRVLSDAPDDGPLARKFVRWLASETQKYAGRRWWLMLDSLDKPSAALPVRDILIPLLLEEVDAGSVPTVHLILVGHNAELPKRLNQRALSESLLGISRGEIVTFLREWVKRRGQKVGDDELAEIVNDVVESRTAPFAAESLDAIREKLGTILEGVLT